MEMADFVVSLIIYIGSCISLPSLLLYLLEILVILRHKQFHNSFNKLFIIRAIANILNLLAYYYGNRLPTLFGDFLLPIYQKLPNAILAIYWSLLYFCFLSDKMATVFIQFNRFTAIVFPLSYEKLWNKLLPFSILFCYGPSLYYAYLFMGMGIQLSYSNSTHSFSIEENQTTFIRDASSPRLVYSVIFLAICTLINAITLFFYKRKNNIINSNSTRTEQKLLIYAMWTFFAEALVTIIALTFNLRLNLYLGDWWFPFSSLLIEICTVVIPSWLMLWASAGIRKQLVNDFLPKRCAKNKSNIVVNVLPQQQHFQLTSNLNLTNANNF